MTATIRTVLGDILPDALGICLPHEHIWCNQALAPRPELFGLTRSTSSWMRLDDDTVEAVHRRRNVLVIVRGNLLRVEEAPGVVQLDVPYRRQLVESRTDLRNDRACRNGLVERVAPEVAHDAAPRALAAGQEDRESARNPTVGPALVLDQRAMMS